MQQVYPALPRRYDPASLRRWLLSHPRPCSYVGAAGIPGSCPAARWLSESLGKPVRVDYDIIYTDDIIGYETPDWLRRFEKKVDKQSNHSPIGRRQALNLLTRAERDTEDDW